MDSDSATDPHTGRTRAPTRLALRPSQPTGDLAALSLRHRLFLLHRPTPSSISTTAIPPALPTTEPDAARTRTPVRHARRPSQAVADRTARALHHRLFLLHCTSPTHTSATFFVLGATGNVYTVTLSANPTCTCPDCTAPCKHILFVLLRVLNVPLTDPCIYRRTLRPYDLRRLLNVPVSGEALAGVRTRTRFHQIFADGRQRHASAAARDRAAAEVAVGEVCPVCLERMERGERMVSCGACGNSLHEECLMKWKRVRGRRAANCVICRARWREKREDGEEGYVNLADVMEEDLAAGEDGGLGSGCLG